MNELEKIINKIDDSYKEVIKVAFEAGDIQRENFRRADLEIDTKSTSVDMVTEVDRKCDAHIVARLKALFPHDEILSEEQGLFPPELPKQTSDADEESYQWIIDPLDGTTNYSIGHPVFAVSIARWDSKGPVFGVVYVPMLNELFYAQRGAGAYMNHKLIKASSQTELGKAVLGTGFPYDRASANNNNGENIKTLIPLIKGVRRMGAAAYDLCLVAAGIYDAFWELRLCKWDMAAGMLMILEAGGVFDVFEEDGKYNVITGNSELVRAISKRVDIHN